LELDWLDFGIELVSCEVKVGGILNPKLAVAISKGLYVVQ